MKFKVGDITKTDLLYIAHGVNCRNRMGSGVARAIYEKWPEVKKRYHSLCGSYKDDAAASLLGTAQAIHLPDKSIFNLFTQLNFGYDGKRYVSYKAIVESFTMMKTIMGKETEVAIPKIGSGLGGGDWNIISNILKDFDDLDITVYCL